MKLYIAVTPDEYELPLYVTDTAAEMAKWHGCTTESIRIMVSRQKHHPRKIDGPGKVSVLFYSVEVEDDEEE